MPFIRILPALLCASTLFGVAAVSPHQIPSDVYLEPNLGQADSLTAFVARGPAYTTLLQHDGAAIYRFRSAVEAAPEDIRMDLRGSHGSTAAGEQPLPSVTHYYAGNDARKWRVGIPHYRAVRAQNVYPGIDMVWRFRGPELEYEFAVDAEADPRQIQLGFSGAHRVWIDRAGNLVAETSAGRLRQRSPVAWQEIAGKRMLVGAGFRLHGGTAGFRLGQYDRHRRLWIDPILSYSSYLGGTGYDAAYAIAVDGSGNIYVTGTTGSASFSPDSGLSACRDAFVTKFSANGSIVYTTILSGSADASGQAIAVDAAGNVYLAGSTEASDFPATPGAWQTVSGGGEDGFAAKLNPTGILVYASYIGGAGNDYATGIAIDQPDNAYISGYTSSTEFPTTPGVPQPSYGGGSYDAFMVKLNAAGSAALYATLLGGSGNDQAQSIALDPAGNVCIAGYTDSTDLPVVAAVQPSYGGEGDALIACLNAAGTAWATVSYLGGSGVDQAYALAIDGSGHLYVAGTTFSQDFPTTPGVFQPAPARSYDAFLAKLGPGAGSVIYATLLGGSGSDAATALVLGSAGDVWLGGYTASFDFPVVGAWQSSNHGNIDGFVAHLSANGSILLSSSYLGGSQEDQVWGVALNSAGLVLVTGSTGSTDFPVMAGAVQSTNAGGYDAFLAQIDPPLTGYAISGQVTVSGAAALAGASLELSGAASGSTTTDASGNYGLSGLIADGTYTVTPSAAGYSFSPPSQTFANLSANQTANFTATCALSISPTAVFLDSTSQFGPPLSVVTTATGCLWVASANAAFIDITSGTNGYGTGAIAFSVPANTTGADLTGTLSVDGQIASITQRETADTFTDVPPPNIFFDFINVMYETGITAGCATSPLQYCPNSTTTRGEMAVFIIVGIEGGNSFPYTATPYFTDVPPTDPYFKFVQKMKDLGITAGCTATMYCPNDPVTRGEMAVFIITGRYGNIAFSYPATPYFSDVPSSSPFFPFVQKMAATGITAGCASGLYCPNNSLTRGQMAVFIVTGLLNQMLPIAIPVITQVLPSSGSPGESVTVTVTGIGSHFVQGTTQVTVPTGITASNVTVTSSTSLTVQLNISPSAVPSDTVPAGSPYSIVVTTGSEEAMLPHGFIVQ
jgi:hypothetical protein